MIPYLHRTGKNKRRHVSYQVFKPYCVSLDNSYVPMVTSWELYCPLPDSTHSTLHLMAHPIRSRGGPRSI